PITVQEQDTFGNPVLAPTGGTTVTLTSNSAGTHPFALTSGGGAVTSATIPSGYSSVVFYYGDTKAGNPTITVSGALTSGTQVETITTATANKFAITSTAVSGAASAGAALGPITVQEQDTFGNPVLAPTGGTTVTLTSNSTGTAIFSATSGGGSVSSVTIPAGASSVAFYYGDTKAGTPTITAGGTLTSATQGETITVGPAAKFVLTSPVSGTASATATLGPITVQEQDTVGNPVLAPIGGTTVTLTSNSTGTAHFALTSGGSAITSVTIPVGFSSVTFYYGDTKAGSPTISAGGTLTSATQTETITAGTATMLAFGQQPSSTAQGSTIAPAITVQIQDQFGNLTTSAATVAIAINHNGGLLGLGALSGTKSKSAVAGVATFNDLSIAGLLGVGAGPGYTLQVTSSSLTAATSTGFSIT
ncbi:MAG TPA: hypothetical protein VHV82_10700, partial [Sporichthyaceae bacterium]|nr:hypothetical protein [Sporichthyaceae bacterium]